MCVSSVYCVAFFVSCVLHFGWIHVFYFISEVGDVRVTFSFAGLSGETTYLGQAQTVGANAAYFV